MAPFWFRDLHYKGVPVFSDLSHATIDVFGLSRVQACSRVNTALPVTPVIKSEPLQIYGSGTASGTSDKKSVAIYKAISEGLERMVFDLSVDSGKYGFYEDPTTNGMSAYPEFFARQCKERAMYEAIERFTLACFWEGKASARVGHTCKLLGKLNQRIELYFLESSIFPNTPTVLLHYYDSSLDFHSYGFSCASSADRSVDQALVELHRNWSVLKHFLKASVVDIQNLGEQRLVHFASVHGWRQVYEKIRRAPSSSAYVIQPKIFYDGPISGFWNRWVKVWRHSLKMPSRHYLQGPVDYFFF